MKARAAELTAELAVVGINKKLETGDKATLKTITGDIAILEAHGLPAALATAKDAKATTTAAVSAAPFPMKSPGVFSIGGAFLMGILVSLMSREKEAEDLFESEKVRTYVGVGAEGSASH